MKYGRDTQDVFIELIRAVCSFTVLSRDHIVEIVCVTSKSMSNISLSALLSTNIDLSAVQRSVTQTCDQTPIEFNL